MLPRDEVKLVGYGALAIAAVLVIMALLLAPSASNQATSQPLPPPQLLSPPGYDTGTARMVRTERFYRDGVAVDEQPGNATRASRGGLPVVRGDFASSDLPTWWTAETTYPILPLPPERPGEAPRERIGEAPTAAAAPSVVDQKETGRPEKAACSRHALRTVWEGQYRWRCRR